MDPTTVPVPRRVRLRKGRFSAPVFVGYLIQVLMLGALYDVVRPLWCMYCLINKGHSMDSVPAPPWDTLMGLTPTTPVHCLVQIVVAAVAFFVLQYLAELLVWKGNREKELLRKGRAITAEVVHNREIGGKKHLTFCFTSDGKKVEREVPCPPTVSGGVGSTVIVILTFDYLHDMLYESCRWEVY